MCDTINNEWTNVEHTSHVWHNRTLKKKTFRSNLPLFRVPFLLWKSLFVVSLSSSILSSLFFFLILKKVSTEWKCKELCHLFIWYSVTTFDVMNQMQSTFFERKSNILLTQFRNFYLWTSEKNQRVNKSKRSWTSSANGKKKIPKTSTLFA